MDRAGHWLQAALHGLGIAGQVEEALCRRAWIEILGPELASEATVTDLSEGELRINCTSPALRHSLDMDRTRIVERLNEKLGRTAVTNIRFQNGGASSPGPRRRRR